MELAINGRRDGIRSMENNSELVPPDESERENDDES